MVGHLVLITGATGHIGFSTLLGLIKAGYRVRAAIRSDAKRQSILNNPMYKKLNAAADQLEFAIVPEITAPGAYSDAIKGVDYVVHLASPLFRGADYRPEEYQTYFIKPAVTGTITMLESAATESKVKRVVITSSSVAIVPFTRIVSNMEDGEVYAQESRIPNDNGPYANEFQGYSASKAHALNASEAWMKEHKPSFDLVNILPSLVEGRNHLALTTEETLKGSNNYVVSVALGAHLPIPAPGATVHSDDVARLHVEALDPRIPAGSYVANSEGIAGSRWEDFPDIVAKLFPEEVKKGLIPNTGSVASFVNHIDASHTEKTFGWKLQGFESQIQSVLEQYLEVLAA